MKVLRCEGAFQGARDGLSDDVVGSRHPRLRCIRPTILPQRGQVLVGSPGHLGRDHGERMTHHRLEAGITTGYGTLTCVPSPSAVTVNLPRGSGR